MGVVVNNFHKSRIADLLRDHQGTIVVGNPNAYEDGDLTPTVVLNPSLHSAIMREEIFGPILPIISYQRFDEVIA
jgi:aldehyde dehydrogenase (NAD+)